MFDVVHGKTSRQVRGVGERRRNGDHVTAVDLFTPSVYADLY